MLHCKSSDNKHVTLCDFVVPVDSNGLIAYKRMFSEAGNAEGLVGVLKSKLVVQ